MLSLGKFDGVHAGHRHVLSHLLEEAGRRGLLSTALVLHPDPVTVLRGKPIGMLTSVQERCHRIAQLGVDIVEPLLFTAEVAELDPDAFHEQLASRFDINALVVGADFALGRDRAGDVGRLRKLGVKHGFDVVAVQPLVVSGDQVSSRRIRRCVASGDIALARTLLRTPPQLRGTVVHGAARGRRLGFPTANLDPTDNSVVPADGLYTVQAEWQSDDDEEHRHAAAGLASIGVRPTFDGGPQVIEVHLLDLDDDLYGRSMTVRLLARQRSQRRFGGADELVAQMHRDVDEGRALIAAEAAAPWDVEASEARVEIRVRGRDLPALCEHAAWALAHVRAAGPPLRVARPRHVSLTADGDEALLAGWLQLVESELALGLARPALAHVYQAGEGVLNGLLPGASESADSARRDAIGLAGPIACDAVGWLEAAVVGDA